MRCLAGAMIATAAVGMSFSALGADLPVKAPRNAAVTQSGAFYFWADGSYQSINLPTYSLGIVRTTGIPIVNLGPSGPHDPRATGNGISGAIGYVLPHGTIPFTWGSNARIEIGGSYVKAETSQSGSGASGTNFAAQLVSGFLVATIACAPPCHTASTLNTDYSSWQIWGKTASDIKFGAVTVSPSLALFGGNTRNEQFFSQTRFFPTGAFGNLYQASTDLDWTDWGARVGIDTTTELTPWLALGLGGSVGVARRSVSLTASDLFTPSAFAPGRSAISVDSSTTPFLANAEASVIVKPLPNMALRAFAGLNYDSRVPGIVAPTFPTGASVVSQGGSPASINFQDETSWYVGGGMVVKFAP